MSIAEINHRYSQLAETECCLSCGNAIQYARATSGETCIDIGSGRGTDVIRLAGEVGENGFVYGVDISEGMLEKANQLAQKMQIKNVKFVRSQLENIDIPSECANLIISNCTLNHAQDKLKTWQEIYRMLKPGGRFVISDIFAVEPIAEEYKNDPGAIAECWAGAVTKQEYFETMNQSGFTNVTILEESAPYAKGKATVASFTISGKKKCNCKKS